MRDFGESFRDPNYLYRYLLAYSTLLLSELYCTEISSIDQFRAASHPLLLHRGCNDLMFIHIVEEDILEDTGSPCLSLQSVGTYCLSRRFTAEV